MKKEFLLAVLFAAFIFSVFGQNTGDFIYRIDNGSITITGYNGSEKDINIPEKINGLPVTAIGDEAFFRKKLTSITFPNTITYIGNRAFSYNRLTALILPDSLVSVGFLAFSNNRLAGITLPDSLVSIGMRAFTENRLKNITLPDSLVYLGDAAFTRNLINSVFVPGSVRNFNSYTFDIYVRITRD